MKERPILFSAPMIRKLLDDSKSQTRRIVKGVDPDSYPYCGSFDDRDGLPSITFYDAPGDTACDRIEAKCRYGAPGDRLFVREGFYKCKDTGQLAWYVADAPEGADLNKTVTKKPSIHMPRKDCRITLEITEVRVERLQNISESDALAEGVRPMRDGGGTFVGREGPGKLVTPWCTAKEAYFDLWDSINGTGAWRLNCWVWVVSFRRITK